MRKNIFVILFVLAVPLFFLPGCSGSDMSESDSQKMDEINEEKETENKDDIRESGIFEGDMLKTFYLEDNSGNSVSSSDLIGSVTLLNFWTSWSLESEAVNDIFSDCANTFKDTVNIVSVNVTAVEGHNLEYVIKYIRDKGYEFPIYFDLEGSVAKKYLIRSFPTTYLIDEKGYIANIYIGEIDEKDFIAEIKELLNDYGSSDD